MKTLTQRELRRLAVLRVLVDLGLLGGPYDDPERYTRTQQARRMYKRGTEIH